MSQPLRSALPRAPCMLRTSFTHNTQNRLRVSSIHSYKTCIMLQVDNTSQSRVNTRVPAHTYATAQPATQSKFQFNAKAMTSSTPVGRGLNQVKSWNQPEERKLLSILDDTTETRKSFTQDKIINKLTCLLMKDGKKAVAQRIIYRVLEMIKTTPVPDPRVEGQTIRLDNPIAVVVQAVENAKPLMECVNMRARGSVHLVPTSIKEPRRYSLAMRWIVDAARKRKKPYTMEERMYLEIMDCYNFKQDGNVIKKRAEVHKTAEANRAFAGFRW